MEMTKKVADDSAAGDAVVTWTTEAEKSNLEKVGDLVIIDAAAAQPSEGQDTTILHPSVAFEADLLTNHKVTIQDRVKELLIEQVEVLVENVLSMF